MGEFDSERFLQEPSGREVETFSKDMFKEARIVRELGLGGPLRHRKYLVTKDWE